MASQPQPLSSIRLPGQRKRAAAQKLLKLQSDCVRPTPQPPGEDAIRVVCISDTHNTRPELPPGDVLIHAGDLTENGSFDEVFVAGNHDVLLDEEFLQRNPERRYEEARTRDDLDWGSVIYLEDTSFTLDFSQDPNDTETAESRNHTSFRKLTVYGSPFTPQYGTSAFQYKPDPDFWTEKFGSLSIVPDILVTHGPPKLHLDTRGFYRAGCPYLSVEVARMRPRLHVFGHIHASQGREDVVLDGMQRAYEDVVIGWGDWGTVGWMVARVLWARLAWLSRGLRARVGENETTTFINASVVGGSDNRLVNEAVVFHC